MKMQTPKNHQKKSPYTSPIGLLKNYNTISAPTNNNSYEQQFYRIKAHRLQSQLDQLKQQNTLLKSKLSDLSTANQCMKQKIMALQNGYDYCSRSITQRTMPSLIGQSAYPNRNASSKQSPAKESKYFSGSALNDKSQRSVHSAQIERLLKQNRILKNEHQVQLTEVRDQNKRLTRKISELQINLALRQNQSKADRAQEERQKLQQKCHKYEKSISQLRNQTQSLNEQRIRLQEKIKAIDDSNRILKKQNQQLKIINVVKNKAQQINKQLQNIIQQNERNYKQQAEFLRNQIKNLKKQRQSQELSSNSYTKAKELNRSPQILGNNGTSNSQHQTSQKEINLLKRKIVLQDQSLADKDEEIKNMLIKLKPLIQKQKNSSKNQNQAPFTDSKRASLSILQVFLKKYKINSF